MDIATATLENLLRAARSEAAVGTAFVALLCDGDPPEIVSVPEAGAPEGLSPDELAELVRQAAADPELRHGGVFVRSVQMGRALTVAVAPLRDAGGSMMGVVAGADHRFEPAQLDVLERLAQRLLRHLQVVQRLGGDGARDGGLRARHGGRTDVTRPTDLPPAPTPDAPAPGATAPPLPPVGVARTEGSSEAFPAGSPATWWAQPDPLTGLSSLGRFFSRTGRMLAADDHTTGALALVVVKVPDPRTTPNAARVLRGQLRFSDPLARVDRDLLAVAVALWSDRTADAVEQRLAAVVRMALERPDAVRTVHVVARPGDPRDVDELLAEAVSRLPGRP